MKRLFTLILLSILFSSSVYAVALTSDKPLFKRIDLEAWMEDLSAYEHHVLMNAFVLDYSYDDNFGLILSSGVGLQDSQFYTMKDLAVLPKYSFLVNSVDFIPRVTLISGMALPTGTRFLSSHHKNSAFLAMAHVPFVLYDGWLRIDTELGFKRIFATKQSDYSRPHLGVHIDMGLFSPNVRLRYMIFTGPYYEIDVPSITNEIGVSYVQDPQVTYDFLLGTQPEINEWGDDSMHNEYWATVGVRISFNSL